MILARLHECLEIWRDSYKHQNIEKEFQLGYPSQSLVLCSGGASSVDTFDNMCDELDAKTAIAMDAMIDSLKFPHRDAIRHQWLGEAKKWPTHEMDYADALDVLMRLAEKRGLE